jgi:hypothetical protein
LLRPALHLAPYLELVEVRFSMPASGDNLLATGFLSLLPACLSVAGVAIVL